jgi:hypothetical protein
MLKQQKEGQYLYIYVFINDPFLDQRQAKSQMEIGGQAGATCTKRDMKERKGRGSEWSYDSERSRSRSRCILYAWREAKKASREYNRRYKQAVWRVNAIM